MSLHITRENLSVSENVYDGCQEQSIELDYILPDYYQDIFKMVKCTVSPKIVSYNLSGSSLNYELSANICFLYASENDSNLHVINQTLNFSKSVNLDEAVSNPDISIKTKADHINCRVANKRRIDIRGAVSVKIKVTGDSQQQAVCDVSGMNMQTKKTPVDYMARKIRKDKVVVLNDEIELGDSKPAVIDIVNSDVKLSETERKVISNKLIIKGDAEVKILYTCTDGMESIIFNMPYSQIIDVDGIDDSYSTCIDTQLVSEDITLCSDNKKIKYEMKLLFRCCGYKTITVGIVCDLYSTAYPCQQAFAKLAIEQPPQLIKESFTANQLIKNDESDISCVYDVRCNSKNINVSVDCQNNLINVSGMLCYTVLIKNENFPQALEKESAFEYSVSCDNITEESVAEINIPYINCSYTLTDSNAISVKADVKLCGQLYSASYVNCITDVSVDDSVKITRDGDYALKLYYGVKGEKVWDIAKKYCTSVKGIMEENSLEGERLSEDGMLLIPIV